MFPERVCVHERAVVNFHTTRVLKEKTDSFYPLTIFMQRRSPPVHVDFRLVRVTIETSINFMSGRSPMESKADDILDLIKMHAEAGWEYRKLQYVIYLYYNVLA